MEKTLLSLQACERSECDAAGCNSFERVQARARDAVDFVDSIKKTPALL